MADAPAVSLADVLWELGPGAKRMLRHDAPSDLAPMRLACHALRDAVDGSMAYLQFKLSPADAHHWRPGLLHARWPHCSCLKLILVGPPNGTRDPGAAALLALPFVGLDQAAAGATRITEVCLASRGAVLTSAEPAISLVAQRLPWLEQLDASGLDAADLSYEPGQLGHMWQALAALPELWALYLPSIRAFAGVGAHLSRFQALAILQLCNDTGSGVADCLAHVLDNLPPSLVTLVVLDFFGRDDVTEIEMHVKDGLITSVEPGEDSYEEEYNYVAMTELAELAQLLLRSRALGPRLELLHIKQLDVNTDPLAGEALASLRALVDRTDRIIFEVVQTTRDRMLSLAQAIELLGKPAVLIFYTRVYGVLRLDRGSSGATTVSSTGSSRGTAAATLRGGRELPSVPRIIEAAVQHVKAAGSATAAAAAGSAGAPGGACHMLLLTGPAVAALGGGAPLEEWVRSVNGGKCLEEGVDVVAYSLIREAGALLMEFGSQAAAAAAAAAAGELWDDRVRKLIWPSPELKGRGTAACLLEAAFEELEEVWAPRFASAAPHEHLDLLRWLWRVLDRLEQITP